MFDLKGSKKEKKFFLNGNLSRFILLFLETGRDPIDDDDVFSFKKDW